VDIDILIVNYDSKYAVGLRYDTKLDNAPRLMVSAVGNIVDTLVAIAKDKGIKIIEHPILAREISAYIMVNEEISDSLYKTVADIYKQI